MIDPVLDFLDLLTGIFAEVTALWDETPNDTIRILVTPSFPR